MNPISVLILMGSDSDAPVMQGTETALARLLDRWFGDSNGAPK